MLTLWQKPDLQNNDLGITWEPVKLQCCNWPINIYFVYVYIYICIERVISTITEILTIVARSRETFICFFVLLFYKIIAMQFIASEMLLTMCELLCKVPGGSRKITDYFLFSIYD